MKESQARSAVKVSHLRLARVATQQQHTDVPAPVGAPPGSASVVEATRSGG